MAEQERCGSCPCPNTSHTQDDETCLTVGCRCPGYTLPTGTWPLMDSPVEGTSAGHEEPEGRQGSNGPRPGAQREARALLEAAIGRHVESKTLNKKIAAEVLGDWRAVWDDSGAVLCLMRGATTGDGA